MDYVDFAEELMKKMVSIPSESQNEEELAVYLCEYLANIGMKAKLQRIEGKSCNVVAKLSGNNTGTRKLLMGGHIDTVTADGDWTFNPLQVRETSDKYFGLGCGDMKGGLASQIAVLAKLMAEGFEFDGEIILLGLCDEERHSIGALDYVRMVRESGERPADFGIFAEPHFDNVVVGATGKVYLNIEVTGATGHATTPEKGINAISCMSAFLSEVDRRYGRLYEQGKAASHSALGIESRSEGYSLKIPDWCRCMMNKQLDTAETPEGFIADLKRIYEETVGRGEISVKREIPFYPSYVMDTDNVDFRALIHTIETVGGFSPELRINQSVSDGNILYHQLGIPVVLFGPQGVNFHKAGEYVVKETIGRYMRILEKYIREFFCD